MNRQFLRAALACCALLAAFCVQMPASYGQAPKNDLAQAAEKWANATSEEAKIEIIKDYIRKSPASENMPAAEIEAYLESSSGINMIEEVTTLFEYMTAENLAEKIRVYFKHSRGESGKEEETPIEQSIYRNLSKEEVGKEIIRYRKDPSRLEFLIQEKYVRTSREAGIKATDQEYQAMFSDRYFKENLRLERVLTLAIGESSLITDSTDPAIFFDPSFQQQLKDEFKANHPNEDIFELAAVAPIAIPPAKESATAVSSTVPFALPTLEVNEDPVDDLALTGGIVASRLLKTLKKYVK